MSKADILADDQTGSPVSTPPSPGTMRAHKPAPTKRRKKQTVKHHSVTVGQIAKQRKTSFCYLTETLADAADVLVESGRTAAVVVDDGGNVSGVLTENDILGFFVDCAPGDLSVVRWLKGSDARLPGYLVPALTLPPETSLAEAAACMASMAEDETGFACHHLLVRCEPDDGGDEQGCQAVQMHPDLRLLSALDIAIGMLQAAGADDEGPIMSNEAEVNAAAMMVEDAMKPLSMTATCTLRDSLAEAFSVLFTAKQNCALVVASNSDAELSDEVEEVLTADELKGRHEADDLWRQQHQEDLDMQSVGGGMVYGVITAGDAIRCYSERLTGETTSLAGWLRGLAPERVLAVQRSVTLDALLSDAAAAMASTGVHHLLVVDPDCEGEVVGVLSALDIVRVVAAHFVEDEPPLDR